MASFIENIQEMTSKNSSHNDDDRFDQRTWDSAEDFLDREGLFIVSPSTLLSQKRLRSMTILLGKSSEQEGEMINTKEIPTFLVKRAKSAKSLGIMIQSDSNVENETRF